MSVKLVSVLEDCDPATELVGLALVTGLFEKGRQGSGSLPQPFQCALYDGLLPADRKATKPACIRLGHGRDVLSIPEAIHVSRTGAASGVPVVDGDLLANVADLRKTVTTYRAGVAYPAARLFQLEGVEPGS